MLADGSVVHCSREENVELFSAVLGGYGLFGIILDVDLATVPNRRYMLDRRVVTTSQLPATWDEAVAAHPRRRRNGVRPIERDGETAFCEDAIVYVMYVDPDRAAPIPTLHEPESVQLRRQIVSRRGGGRVRQAAEVAGGAEIAAEDRRDCVLAQPAV